MNDRPPPRPPAQPNPLQVIETRLKARIARLERAQHRRRWTTGALLVGLAGSISLSAAIIFDPGLVSGVLGASSVVRAHRFILEDADGNVRGSWRLVDDGSVRFGIHDAAGRSRLNLTVLGDGAPGISLVDAEDRRRIVLGLLPDQTGTLVFADGGGTARAVLGVSSKGSASLLFADDGGVSRVSLGLGADGIGNLVLPQPALDVTDGAEGGDGR